MMINFKYSILFILLLFLNSCFVRGEELDGADIDLRDYYIPHKSYINKEILYNKLGFVKSREITKYNNPDVKAEFSTKENRYCYLDAYCVNVTENDITQEWPLFNDNGEKIGEVRTIYLKKPIQNGLSWNAELIYFNDKATQKDKNKYRANIESISQTKILNYDFRIRINNEWIGPCIATEWKFEMFDKYHMSYTEGIYEINYYCKGKGGIKREIYKDTILGKRLVREVTILSESDSNN